ncbi:MAG: hypothetical protein ABIP17_02645 [Ilumatobacteraceae bacterium]
MAELLDAWFDQASQDFSPKTVLETRGFIDRNLRSALGTVPLTVQYGHVYANGEDGSDEVGFYAVVVEEIFVEGCAGSDSGVTEVGPSADDLAQALLDQPGSTKNGPFATTLGGYPATRIDLAVPDGFDLAPCNASDIGLQIWYSAPADKNFVLLKNATANVYIVDIDGARQVFLTQSGIAAPQELAELQEILDSIRIES